MSRVIALLLVSFGAAFGAPTVVDQKSDAPRESFEEFLARAKSQRDALQAKLGAQVKERVAALEPPDKAVKPEAAEKALSDLVALGSEATPLIVPYLDPGAAPGDREHYRSMRVAVALSRMDTTPVLDSLLAALGAPSDELKKNALRALEGARERDRVRPRVMQLFQSSQGPVRQNALRTLFALGGASDQELVSQVLLGDDRELSRLALGALADSKNASLLDRVDQMLADPKKATPVIGDVINYFTAVSESLHDGELRALVQLAGNSTEVELERRILILDALPTLTTKLPADVRKTLEPMGQARDRKLREAALVALICLGEKSARKDLLLEYDERIKKQERWGPSFADRAEILYRIRDYDAAIKDFAQAMLLERNDSTPHPDLFIGTARCYAMLGKFKEAVEWIEKAPLGLDDLAKLASDPAFAKLAAHSKYGGVFHQK